MKITLAYPQDGDTYPGVRGAADATVDVDDGVGQQIISDGWARPADDKGAKAHNHQKEG